MDSVKVVGHGNPHCDEGDPTSECYTQNDLQCDDPPTDNPPDPYIDCDLNNDGIDDYWQAEQGAGWTWTAEAAGQAS
jgi:hypothetical protein